MSAIFHALTIYCYMRSVQPDADRNGWMFWVLFWAGTFIWWQVQKVCTAIRDAKGGER